MSVLTEDAVINKFKILFSRLGRCDVIRTDNGPQFQSKFKKFAETNNIYHVTSSPKYSQSNGEAESAVKVAKSLIEKNDDILDALLDYRTTPLANGYSPAELLMGRRFKNVVPTCPKNLITPLAKNITDIENKLKEKQRIQFNKRHRVVSLEELQIGDKVWVTDIRKYGIVNEKHNTPRSYIIKCADRYYRRNRQFLIKTKSMTMNEEKEKYNISDDIHSNIDIDAMLATRNEAVDFNENTLPNINDNQAETSSLVYRAEESFTDNDPGPSNVATSSIGDRSNKSEPSISIESESSFMNITEHQLSSNSSLSDEPVEERDEPVEENTEREKRVRRKPNWFGF